MAKIVRFNGNLVAPASAALGTERTLFGSASQADDLTSQFTADLRRGWGIVGPSDQPTLQDFNAMGYTLGHLHAYLHQVGVAEWNSGQEYHLGSIANSSGLLFYSLTNTNTGNDPASNSTNWNPAGTGSTSVAMSNANVTLTAIQAARPVIIITGTLTANVQLIFPAYAGRWVVINNTAGAFTVTCKTAAGTGVVVSSVQSIVGDGTKIISPATPALTPGVVGESRNAAMAIAAASASATFTADEVIVESAVTGRQYRLTNVNASINLATTGAGGMDTGAAPASGYVALYVIYNPTTNTVAMLATNATAAKQPEIYGGANMPAGYTASALVAVLPTNGSSQFAAARVSGRKVWTGTVTVLTTSAMTGTLTSFPLSAGIPRNAKSWSGVGAITSTVTPANLSFVVSGSSVSLGAVTLSITNSAVNGGLQAPFADIPITTDQTAFYAASSNAGTPTLSIVSNGYTF